MKQQKQKNIRGVKAAFIWEELDERYGVLESQMEVAV